MAYIVPDLSIPVILTPGYSPPPLTTPVILGAPDNAITVVTDKVVAAFVGTHIVPTTATINIITSTVLSSIFLNRVIPTTVDLIITTAPVTSIFSASSTINGTFEKILPDVLIATITGKFTWFFVTVDIQVGPSIIPFIRIASTILVILDSTNLLLNPGQFIGTVPLRYEVIIFSYLDSLQRSFIGKNYPAGSLQNTSLIIQNVNMSGIVPIAITGNLSLNNLTCNFNSLGISLIGVNLQPHTNTLQAQLFVRVDVPKLITLSATLSCNVSFYGHVKNYGSFEVILANFQTSIRILVPLQISGNLSVVTAAFVYTPWSIGVANYGTLSSVFYSNSSNISLRCFIAGPLSSTLNNSTSLFSLIRKDKISGTLIGLLTVSANIYVQGNHYIPVFNAVISNTITARFIGLNTKIGVKIDIKNSLVDNVNSFTGPFFKSTSYIQAQFNSNLQNISNFIQGTVLISGSFNGILTFNSNINVFTPILGYAHTNLQDIYLTSNSIVGVLTTTGHLFKTLNTVIFESNFANTYFSIVRFNLSSTLSGQFLGRSVLLGSLQITTQNISSQITINRDPYIKEGHIVLVTQAIYSQFLGLGGEIRGSLNLNLNQVIWKSQASNTLLTLSYNSLNIFSTINVRTVIYGQWSTEIPLEITSNLYGTVPKAVSVVMDLALSSVVCVVKARLTTLVNLDARQFYVDSYFYGTATTGFFDNYLNQTILEFYAMRGERPSFHVLWSTETITTQFLLRVKTQGSLNSSTNILSGFFVGIAPIRITGYLISNVNSAFMSNFRLSNLKFVYAENNQILTPSINSFIVGSIQLVGVLQPNSFTVVCSILGTVPILTTVNITSVLYSPQISMIGWIPLYGQLITITQNDSFISIGSATIGSLKKTLDSFNWNLRGVTVLRIDGTLQLNLDANINTDKNLKFTSYGYLLFYRGSLNINVPQDLYGEIRLHTPLVVNQTYFGSFLKTLNSVTAQIFIRLELIYGVLEAVLPMYSQYIGWSQLTGVLNIPSSQLGFKLNFIDNSYFVVGTITANTATNTNGEDSVPLQTSFRGFTKLILLLHTTLNTFNFKMYLHAIPAFRIKMDVLGYFDQYRIWHDSFPVPKAIILGIVPDFIYGQLHSTIASLIASDINFRGIAATKIFGIFENTTKDVIFNSKGFTPLYMTIGLNLATLSWFGKAANITVYMDLVLDDLNKIKNKIIGIAATSITGLFNSTFVDFYQFLKIEFKGRSEIYGQVKINTSTIVTTFRTNPTIVGYIIGGDVEPCEQNDCFNKFLLPIVAQNSRPYPKQYWTLAYTTSNISLKYTPNRYTGIMYGTLNERKRVEFDWYDFDLKKNIHLIFDSSEASPFSAIFKGGIPIQGSLNGYEEYTFLNSFIGYREAEIYGTVAIQVTGTFHANLNISIKTKINLRFSGNVGNFNSDLPILNCEWFGLIEVAGNLTIKLAVIFANITAIIPIPISSTLSSKLENAIATVEAFTPFQVFGRLRNYYILYTTSTFYGRTLILGSLENVILNDVDSYFSGRSVYVTGFIDAKLDRIYVKIIAEHDPSTLTTFVNFNNLLQSINPTIRLMIPIFGRITNIQLNSVISNISILVPIRIYATLRFNTETLKSDINGIVALVGSFNNSLDSCNLIATGYHTVPLLLNLDLQLDSVTGFFACQADPTGNLSSTLNSFSIEDIGVVGNSYGYLTIHCQELLCISELWTTEKSLYLPNERLYALSGVVSTEDSKGNYRINLHDVDSGELLQSITTVPNSYSFNKVEFGRFVVVATPLTGSFRSQALTVSTTEETSI